MRKTIFLTLCCLLFALNIQAQQVTQGGLEAVGAGGKALGACPLKHTDVKAEISGFLSRVKVTQEFENNFSEKIEAVYVFPLPQNAAVDDMMMRIGERTVRSKILKREEAREVYEAAKSNGQIASLLDQERPNIFTQAVANILPHEKIIIEISYVETLKYEDGAYEFVFPMVVGPRYIPGNATGKQGGGFAPDTDRVPDASKITPMPAKDRAGHDISIAVKLDAGVSVENVASKSHEIESAMLTANSYNVKLKNEKTIPNKDFVLRYDVAGKRIEDAVLTHRGGKGGYFTLILQPPDEVRTQDVTPKEIVFVLDTSGSMSGFPIEKAKESMKMALDNLNPQDTFNLITFSGDTHILFEKPVPANGENLKKAQAFLESRQGRGGTEMMKAIKAALDASDSQQHVRVVCFMTDGYVGNDLEIIGEIQKHPNARIFSFGIGNSVNRFLLDKMAEEGRGEVEYVALNDDGSAAAKRFYERVRSPLLTDISLDFGNLQVADVYPKRINDLFSAKPVVIHGRFTKAGSGVIKLKGKSFGRETVREIAANFPENEPRHDVLATLWARTRIDDLMSQDYAGVQNGNPKPEVKDTITNLGIEYRLLTQFTSFVAVEERVVTDGGQPRKIEVPVEMPEGVSREGVFGKSEAEFGVMAGSLFSNRAIKSLPINGRSAQDRMRVTAGRRNVREKSIGAVPNSVANVRTLELSKSVDNEAISIDGAESDSPIISRGIKATTLPKPEYPQNANANGAVNVEVTLDASGSVVSAKAISGDKMLYQSAEAAAKNSKFAIPKLSVEINKITGVMAYNFTATNKTVMVSEQLQNVRVETKPNKYHSSVRALVERLKNKQTKPSEDEAKFVRDGKADVVIRLKELKPETVAELKKLGFEILTEMASAKAVVGRIAVEKISALAEIDAVTFVSPQNR
ncbi:MAG: VWA domain-containing protein [Acidobacteria bacterium]|nr:VWA domain-containing protein [Acidobacteriota bacterium]